MFVVAIPVCNERERIIDCLQALAEQVDVPLASLGLLLFLNNCTDETRELVEAWLPTSPCPVRVVERDSKAASAGWARREAMNAAAAWLEEMQAQDAILLTTDADSRVSPDWVARNRVTLLAGADAVAGRIAFNPVEVAMLPPGLRTRQKLEFEYEMLLAEIEARLHPRQGNPWPCHWTKSGASIAVSLEAYRQVGGIPSIASGEDHAFVDLVRAQGLVVRHAPDIVVTTSGRLDGRARDGTADTLKRHCDDLDAPCDARLERVVPFALRVVRRRLAGPSRPMAEDRRSPQRALRPHELPRQISRARLLLSLLRPLEARRADSPLSESRLSRERPKRLSMP